MREAGRATRGHAHTVAGLFSAIRRFSDEARGRRQVKQVEEDLRHRWLAGGGSIDGKHSAKEEGSGEKRGEEGEKEKKEKKECSRRFRVCSGLKTRIYTRFEFLDFELVFA